MASDEELMVAFRDGAEAAFDALFERYRQAIWRFFRRRVPERAQAEELAQDTFVALVRGAPRYEPRSAFRSYLFGIAFNILSAARRRAPMASLPLAGPAIAGEDPELRLWVRNALAALEETDREVLMLREYEQLSYDEIAELLGIPIGTVRSRLFRARMALREELVGREAAGARR